jgi:hypothetical protein
MPAIRYAVTAGSFKSFAALERKRPAKSEIDKHKSASIAPPKAFVLKLYINLVSYSSIV